MNRLSILLFLSTFIGATPTKKVIIFGGSGFVGGEGERGAKDSFGEATAKSLCYLPTLISNHPLVASLLPSSLIPTLFAICFSHCSASL